MNDRERKLLERQINGALRDAIHAHGPITPEWVGSASKRILGGILKGDDAAIKQMGKRLAPPAK